MAETEPSSPPRSTPRSHDVALILPSYHMYNAVYRLVHGDSEDYELSGTATPPLYERTDLFDQPSGAPSEVQVPPLITPRVSLALHDDIVADENTTQWQNTVIDNIADLKNLSGTDNAASAATKISIHFTKEIGEIGRPMTPVDLTRYEHNRLDFMHGYVLIENTSDQPIPFDMFYLLFEGSVAFKLGRKRIFLQMFDFSALLNPTEISRLLTEWLNPYNCSNTVDPMDGTYVSFADDFTIHPGRVYKRFFTFKIPNFLLDLACSHHLPSHVEVPPSLLGASSRQFRDFAINGTTVTYGIMARFIGRKHHYHVDPEWYNSFQQPAIVNTKGEEFIILRDSTITIRTVQRSDPPDPAEDAVNARFNKSLYDNLHARAREHIKRGNEILNGKTKPDDIQRAKYTQLYEATQRNCKGIPDFSSHYEVMRPIAQHGLFLGTVAGNVKLRSPKKRYLLDYIYPKQFRRRPQAILPKIVRKTWKLQVPVELIFEPATAKTKFPEITSFRVDFVCLTFQLEKYAIPIVFHHDFVNNQIKNQALPEASHYSDILELSQMVEDTRVLYFQLRDLHEKLGTKFSVEQSLIDDMMGICQLETKANNLDVETITCNNQPVTHKSLNKLEWTPDGGVYKKSLVLDLDLDGMQMKGYTKSKEMAYDRFTLVPSFQHCHLGRIYYLRVSFGLSSGEYIHLKLPVNINKPWSEQIHRWQIYDP